MNVKHIFIGTVVLLLLFSFGCLSGGSTTTTTGTQHSATKTPQKTQNSGHNNKSMNGKGSKAETNQTKQQSKRQNQNKQSEMSAGNHKGWKTYSDATYGYTLKYPANWSVNSQGGALQVNSPMVNQQAVSFQIKCAENKSINSVSEITSHFKHMAALFYHVSPTVENQTINGLTVPVISFDIAMSPSQKTTMTEYIFWNGKSHVYCVAATAKTPQTNSKVYGVIQQIIGTFQFQ